MAGVTKHMKDLYSLAVNSKAPFAETLPLVQPAQVFAIVAIYLTFTWKLGPLLMKKRPPYNLDKIILIYDGLQVLVCAYVFLKGAYTFLYTYKLFCQPIERFITPEAWENVFIIYMYYLLKVADLFDTVFFILRKKFSHVTFLHVYHHAGMVMLSAGSVIYVPGGHGCSIGILNCFVHCVMYSYYFVALCKPDYKKNIWWKKYITQLQIVQFFTNLVHIGSILFIPNCEYPRFVAFILLPQNIFMLLLFADFYYKEYVQGRTKPSSNTLTNSNKESIKQD